MSRPARPRVPALVLSLLVAASAGAEPLALGGDVLAGGTDPIPAAPRDLLATGPSLTVAEPVHDDAMLAGFAVTVSADTGGDLAIAGGDVAVEGPVAGDLTVMGFAVRVAPAARVGGNARLLGGSVALGAPVEGALVATGGSVTLDAAVAGDAWISAESVTFGPAAAVGGHLHLATTGAVEVPERVAPADRVTTERIEPEEAPARVPPWAPTWRQGWGGMGPGWMHLGAGALSGAALLTLAFLVTLGLVLVLAMPVRVEAMRARVARRPGASLLLGLLGLSALVGLVPVSAITVIGLPLVPVVVLLLVVAWTLGYLLGAYTVAMGVLDALFLASAPHGTGLRIAALAIGLALAAVLNFIPVLGWIANVLLMLLGLGALTAGLAERLGGPARPRPEPVAEPAP